MKNLDALLDHTKKVTGLHSDRKLSLALEFSPGMVFSYRNHGKFPSDEAMLKIAELAQIDPDEALLMLNVWRTTGQAKKRYLAMLSRGAACLAVILTMNFGFLSHEARALNLNDNSQITYENELPNIMIMQLIAKLGRRMARALQRVRLCFLCRPKITLAT